MSEDHDEITRKRVHDLADAVHLTMLKTAVIEERQAHVVEALSRIEATTTATNGVVTSLHTSVAVLEDRQHEARNTAAKWGAALGAFVAAVIGGVSAFFGGKG